MAKKKAVASKSAPKAAKKTAKKSAPKKAAKVTFESVAISELVGFAAEDFKNVGELKTWINEEIEDLQNLLVLLNQLKPTQKLSETVDIEV